MLGERRLLPARRGAMTVLGKVTVPKPINLPSQKLENHGLDPNVEIVPKGTLNWGTRSSSSAHNAWASPAQSPPKIGGAGGSPSHFNGRPSSSGSGTRPSTAGSDKSHDPVPNVWGPSSRPSSSSGVLASNQTSLASSRPRSAEPRPASSQLSRFAEPITENSVTWGAPGTMEKLGVSSSKNKDFALSSGDFPSLGTEKTTETLVRQGHSSQGRPVSASGRPATPKQRSETSPSEEGSINANEERGIVSTLKNGNMLEVEAGDPPSMENWQRSYPDPNLPQQYGPWHGAPPHNPPNGVWYRAPFVGPPYGSPGPPGSYPHEPYPYYQPRFPGRPPANMQPVMQPGSAPSGYFPDKGDSHRPRMPESYMQPVMPFGPGPYPVQMPYDGYYGPPRAGSCMPNERRPPVMGMAGAPCVYNRYPMQNAPHDPGNFHGSSGYGPPNTKAKEHVGSGHPHGTRQGPYKVLLKHQDGWDETDSTDRREHSVNIPCVERDNHTGKPTREVLPGVDRRHDEQVSSSKVPRMSASSQSTDSRRGNTQVVVDLGLPEGMGKVNRVEDNFARKPEEDSHQIMSTKRSPTLIEQIEQLNNKARKSEGRYGAGHVHNGDEKLKSLRVLTPEADDAPSEAGSRLDCSNETPTGMMLSSPTFDMNSSRDKRHEATAFMKADASRPVHEPHAPAVRVMNSSSGVEMIHHNAQKRPYGLQGRTDNRGKGRSNPSKDEEWRKKDLVTDSSAEVHPIKDEICDDTVVDHHAALRMSEKANLIQGKAGGELSAFDPSDHQRAKMREIAAERAKQLQKEEEERTREQKARALAKLEELNRRTLAEVSTEKVDRASPPIEAAQNKRDSHLKTGPVTDANTYNEVASSSSGWNSNAVTVMSGYDTHGQGSTDLPVKAPLETPISAEQDPEISNNISVPLPLELDANVVVDHKTSQDHDTIALKPKQIGNKRKQSTNKNLSDKSISTGHSGHVKSDVNVAVDVNSLSAESNPHSNANAIDDALPKQKKKNNRSGKNKHKLDEVLAGARSPKLVPVDGNSVKSSAEISKPKTTVSVFEVGSVQVPFSIENTEAQDSTDQGWSLPTEEVKIVNNQSKPQSSRRLPKSTQGARIPEKFHGSDSVVWAPVASLRKTEDSEGATLNTTVEVHTSSVVGRGPQSNHRSRRAEMERYVPKPVAKEAKEHFTQGNTDQMPSSSVNQGASSVLSGRPESVSLNKEISGPDLLSGGKDGIQAVTKIGESKHNKHGKTHGLWRPRASGEVPLVEPPLEESCYSSDPSKTVQKPSDQQQTPKPEFYLSKEQARYPDSSEASTSLISNETVSDRAMKDRGSTSRGKRQAFKGHKGTEHIQNNLDHKDLRGAGTVEADFRTSLESNKLDGRISLGEKQAVDTYVSSHWQPKSQGYIPQNHPGSSRANGGQRVSSRVGKAPKAEYPIHRGEPHGSRTDKEYNQALVHPHSDKLHEQKTVVAGEPNVHHQEPKPERKRTDSPKQGPRFVDKHSLNPDKQDSPENVDSPHEQPNSGLRRHEHQNSRFVRGHRASHGPQNPGVQDNSRQQLPPSNDKRRHDSHYEYQRARTYANESIESFEEGPRVTGSRYRERGQTHSRRGGANSFARNGGTSRVHATSSNKDQIAETLVSQS
ncbi:hypothetical protein AQUCO_06100049v1 [Aquilegia coerulea]|uniref:BAT2 N-terminal domain-containing protein n=1 Tax=Aquilegia coerulea TaxID=218851 RepID=A0A2G5CEJ9_AQUCA|nr:hypothetical protein AQUCO_06100049v1 [Aquilegia coerulea]PIA29267.1 hypothetical protein AQUCO_06100049v1 [Aquilegia coerulea]